MTSTTHATIDTVDDALANLARCARLRQAVLERAFAGRLVAGEDSIDEAAAAPTSVDCRAPSSARKTRRRASSRRPAR